MPLHERDDGRVIVAVDLAGNDLLRIPRGDRLRLREIEVGDGHAVDVGLRDEIMDRAAADGTRPAPITIYRALDFLRDNGLVHRIESRNAFVACVSRHESGEMIVFLICEHCGAVGEAPSAAVADQLKSAARGAGFTPKAPVIEISGVCAHCQKHERAT